MLHSRLLLSLSRVWLFATPWTAAHQASLSSPNSQSWVKLMSIESVMPFNHLIFCCLLLLLPSMFPNIRVFPMSRLFPSCGQSIGASASASVLPTIYRVDFLYDWLVCSPCYPRDSQESSPAPQFKNINSLVLSLSLCSNSNICMTRGKTIALTIWILLAKWCLCFLLCCWGLWYLFFQGAGVF